MDASHVDQLNCQHCHLPCVDSPTYIQRRNINLLQNFWKNVEQARESNQDTPLKQLNRVSITSTDPICKRDFPECGLHRSWALYLVWNQDYRGKDSRCSREPFPVFFSRKAQDAPGAGLTLEMQSTGTHSSNESSEPTSTAPPSSGHADVPQESPGLALFTPRGGKALVTFIGAHRHRSSKSVLFRPSATCSRRRYVLPPCAL